MLAVLLLALAPAADAPRFEARSAAGEPVAGELRSLNATELRVGGDRVAVGDLIAVRRVGAVRPPWPREPQLVLANGDRVPATVVGGDARTVRVRVPFAADPWAVPLSALAAVWVVPPPAGTPADPARYPWRPAASRGDVVLLRNGDRLTGTLDAVAADGSSVTLAGEKSAPQALELARIAAVAFDPLLAKGRKPKDLHFRLVTADGSRLTLTDAASDGAMLTGTASTGGSVRVPVDDVVSLDGLGGKATYLSDLKPRATTEPYNGVAWPWAADRGVKGGPLRLAGPAGGVFDKGLGTHPRTLLRFPLAGKFRRFEATVGMDPVTGRHGAAVLRVLADGRDVTPSGLSPLTAASGPVPLTVDVTGVKELTLETDFGPTGDVQADVTWADARVIE